MFRVETRLKLNLQLNKLNDTDSASIFPDSYPLYFSSIYIGNTAAARPSRLGGGLKQLPDSLASVVLDLRFPGFFHQLDD